jgi:hypothetical protein
MYTFIFVWSVHPDNETIVDLFVKQGWTKANK